MFATSKDILNIAIAVGILAGSGFLSYLFYHTSKVMEESAKSLRLVNKNLEKVDGIVDDVSATVHELTTTVRDANRNIVKRVSSLGQMLRKIPNIISILTKK